MSPIDTREPGSLVRWFLRYGTKKRDTRHDLFLMVGYLLGGGDMVHVHNDRVNMRLSKLSPPDGGALYEVTVFKATKATKVTEEVEVGQETVFSALVTDGPNGPVVTYSDVTLGPWKRELRLWYEDARECLKEQQTAEDQADGVSVARS